MSDDVEPIPSAGWREVAYAMHVYDPWGHDL